MKDLDRIGVPVRSAARAKRFEGDAVGAADVGAETGRFFGVPACGQDPVALGGGQTLADGLADGEVGMVAPGPHPDAPEGCAPRCDKRLAADRAERLRHLEALVMSGGAP